MSSRRARLTTVLVVLVLAILCIALAVLAEIAYSGYSVPLQSMFLAFARTTWRILGIGAFLIALLIIIVIALRPQLMFQVKEVTDRTLKPQLHVRCRNCGTVDRLEDTGQRPFLHFCPKCGTQGEYQGPESGEKDFIYTRIEMKLGCTRCNTTFRIPEPLVRPLFTECPNCHAKGILKEDQRPQDAQEVPMRCGHCGHGYHVYAVRGHWASVFSCPSCGTLNQMPTPA